MSRRTLFSFSHLAPVCIGASVHRATNRTRFLSVWSIIVIVPVLDTRPIIMDTPRALAPDACIDR
jgi:hypothetical protein